MLNKRIISALVALPLLFAAVILGKYIFFAGICILTIAGLYEYFKAVSNGGVKPMKLVGHALGIILLFFILNNTDISIITPVITLDILILLSIPIFNQKYNFLSAGATIIGILYIPLFFSYLYLIRSIHGVGLYLVWFVFISSWFSDTFAYFTGRVLGKIKLCPTISPKKTVEGSIGGIISSIMGCIVYGMVLNRLSILNIPILHLAIMGLLGSILSQLGDLAASSIKRNVGIKDYGNIMPGHGGVLDRFDSILFVAPLIYYYITLFLL